MRRALTMVESSKDPRLTTTQLIEKYLARQATRETRTSIQRNHSITTIIEEESTR